MSPADSNRVWALVENENGGVFRSDDGGETWTKTNDERKLRQRAFYYTHIFADPKDRDVVYVMNTGFYKSTDGGKTFPTTIRVPHGDNHDLWIDPTNPDRMIGSNDGGGTVSVNGGATWTDEDYPTAQFYHVTTTSDFPYHVCGAQQDNTTACVSSEARLGGGGVRTAPVFYDAGGGESGYIAQSPTDPDVFYAGSQGALITRYNRKTGEIRDIQVYPLVLLRRAVERAQGALAVDVPDRLLAEEPARALHDVAAPVEDPPTTGRRGSASART